MKRLMAWSFILLPIACFTLVTNASPPGIVPGNFAFSSFNGPVDAVVLGVQGINENGEIAGYYTTPTGAYRGFKRLVNGTILTLIAPLDTTLPGFTIGGGINSQGTVGGEFFGGDDGTYSGFFYRDGQYVEYDLPGQPPFTTTALYGLNDRGDFCGITTSPPFTTISGFVNIKGKVTIFNIPGTTDTRCFGINDQGQAVGTYADPGTGRRRSFIRDSKGTFTYVDIPGANSIPGQGTVMIGINDLGVTSGHFWDSSNKEHGFVRTRRGKLLQIDVPFPGATETAGGGINNLGAVTGHWTDIGGVQRGYVATPNSDDEQN